MICILLVMLIQAVRYFPFKFGGWNQVQLSFSYEYGFIQRGFLGTMLSLASGLFHIPWGYMRYVHGFLVMGIFTALMLFIVYRALESERIGAVTKSFLAGLALVFFMGPGWSTNYSNFGLTELWLPVLCILGMYLLVKGRFLWCVPVICAVCILIHTAYVFLYFNLVLVAFFYKIFIAGDGKRRYIITGMVSFALTSALFLYLMFFATAKEGVTVEYVLGRTAEFLGAPMEEAEGHREAIQGYLFRDGGFSGIAFDIKDYWLILTVMLVLFSPFIYEVIRYWRLVAAQAKAAGRKSLPYALVPFGVLTTIPMYVMHCDYGRWTYAAFFYEFACIWLLNLTGDGAAVGAAAEMMKIISKNKVYYLVLLFYAGVSGAFSQNLINPMVSMVESYGWKILEALGM